jgi:cytochrome P450
MEAAMSSNDLEPTAAARARPSDFLAGSAFLDPTRPIQRDGTTGQYHVFSFHDVRTVLENKNCAFTRDPAIFGPRPEGDDMHPAGRFMWAFEPFGLHGEKGRHDVLRALVEAHFRKQRIQNLESMIRKNAQHLRSEIVRKGTGKFNLAHEYAYPLATSVISQIVGFPQERAAWVRKKLNEFSEAESFQAVPRQWDLEAYVWKIISKRQLAPQNELLDALIGSWAAKNITDEELVGYVVGFLIAGSDTTGAGITNVIALLGEAGHLDSMRAQADGPEALGRAVKEANRFMPAFPTKPLFAQTDTEINGVSVSRFSVVNLWLAAANRDPATAIGVQHATDLNTFDPTRPPTSNLTFGHGIHYCLGAPLAELEMRIALEEILKLPGLALDAHEPFVRVPRSMTSLVLQAPFVFDS